MQTERILHTGLMAMLCCIPMCIGAQEAHDSGQRQEKDGALREIVVTGTGTQHTLRDVPVQTEVISRKMLDSYGGKSLEDILGGLCASFSFAEGDMGSQMQMGGLGNNYILILVDGKRLHGDVGGENDLGLIDPQNIERIEIVKGAQSALYGSDAMAGVINIITRKHEKESLCLENTSRWGSYADFRQHNTVAFSLGRMRSQTNFQMQKSAGWQNTADEYTEGKVVHDSRNKTVNSFDNWQLSQRLDYDLTRSTSLYAEGSIYKKGIYRPQDGNYPSCDVYTYDLRYRNASASAGGKWKLNSHDAMTLDLDWNRHAYYYDYTARTYEFMRLEGEEFGDLDGEWYSVPMYAGQSKLQSDQQRMMAQLKGVFALPHQNMLSAGAEYRYDYLRAPLRTDKGTADDWTGALYVQDEFNMLGWLNITAGARLVGNASYGLHFTPKVSAMLSLGDFRLRMGWSQGFKSPTVKELHYRYLHVMGSSTFFNIGNTDLKPQTNNYYSANAEYRGRRLTASVSGYLNRMEQMIALANVPVGEIPSGVTTAYLGDGSGNVQARMYKNMDDARTYGVDANISYNFAHGITLTGAYSWLQTEANLYDASHDRMRRVTIDGTANHKWSASAIWNHDFCTKYRLGINLSTRGSSTRYYENNGNGSPFQIWRINTTHDLGRHDKREALLRLEAGVDNIFDYRDRTMHPYHLGTTSAGRTVYGTLSIRFNQGKRMKTNNNSNTTKQQNSYEED